MSGPHGEPESTDGGAERRRRWLSAAAVAVLPLVPLVWTPWLDDAYRLGKESLTATAAVACLALLSGERLHLPRAPVLAAGVFAAGLLLASSRGGAPSAGRWLLLYASWLLLLLAYSERAQNDEFVGRAELALVAGAVLQAAIGLGQLIAGRGASKLLVVGTIGNSEQLSTLLGVAFCMALHRPGRWRWLAAPLAAALLAARSRGALLALAIALGVVAWPHLRARVRHVRAAAAGGVLLLAAVALVWRHLPDPLTSLHTLRGRWMIWSIAVRELAGSWGLGIGLGAFRGAVLDGQAELFSAGGWEAFADNAALVSRVHNDYLDLLVEGGLPMFAGWAVLSALAARAAWARRRGRPGIAAALLFALLHASVSFPFHVHATLPALALLFGAALAGCEPSVGVSVPRWTVWVAAAALLGLAANEARLWRAAAGHRTALQAIAAGELAVAEQHLDRSLALRPTDEATQLTRARLLYQSGRLEPALAAVRALSAGGRAIDPLKLEGRILIDLGRFGDALLVFKTLAAAYPNHVTPRFDLGRCYLALGRLHDAKRAFEEARARRAVSAKGKWEQQLAAQYLEGIDEQLRAR